MDSCGTLTYCRGFTLGVDNETRSEGGFSSSTRFEHHDEFARAPRGLRVAPAERKLANAPRAPSTSLSADYAAQDVRAKLAGLAGLPPDEVEIRDGRIRRRGAAGGVPVADVLRQAGVPEVIGEGTFALPDDAPFEADGKGTPYAIRTFGAIFDPTLGRSKDLAGVAIPVNADIPSNIEIHFVDEFDAHASPLGARGIGELGATGVAAAPPLGRRIHALRRIHG